jgi:archaellum component FlaG (FlaF/FlaG flagellin family)
MTRKRFLSLLVILLSLTAQAAKDKGPSTRLDVASQPPGATVSVDYKAKGVTPLTLTDLEPGPHLVQVSLANYRDGFDSVVLETGVSRVAEFKLEPLTGILLLTTVPDGCEVSLKGVSLGITPLLVTTLESGTHRLTIASPGYQPKEIEVTLEGRTPLKQEVSLMSDSGTIAVTSDPAGAEVLVNGISRGKSPCRVDRIPGGSVSLEIKADGFQPHTRDVTLAAGEVQTVDVQLKPLPGTLRVVSIPEAGRVYIGDEFKGETPYDLANAKPGTYRVRVERTGYEPVARDVTLDKGASITEEFRLTKNTGRLELVTAPAGSTVLIDGKKVGITLTRGTDTSAVSDPFAIEEALEGEHTVEIFRKGFATQKRKIEIKRGETLTLQFKLIRQFIPNYEVTTTRSYYKGVLEFQNEEGIRIETAPGISQTIPMKDVKKHGPLQVSE